MHFHGLYLLQILLWLFFEKVQTAANLQCRDPDLGGQTPIDENRKFVLIGGQGGGIGNFLIFFPSAYWFAAMTGRDILIIDGSLIGEMCSILSCGFVTYNSLAAAFPSILPADGVKHAKGAKAFEFSQHLAGEINLDVYKIVRADGFKYLSGYWSGKNGSEECIMKLSGCARDDILCADRHAMQRLIRGPFKPQVLQTEESRIIGVPQNLKHAIMSLPHAFSPRLDAAVHLRVQFQHFERLVGPEDPGWDKYLVELAEWLGSSDPQKGNQLFKTIESKIMEELPNIKSHSKKVEFRRLAVLNVLFNDLKSQHKFSSVSHIENKSNLSGFINAIFGWFQGNTGRKQQINNADYSKSAIVRAYTAAFSNKSSTLNKVSENVRQQPSFDRLDEFYRGPSSYRRNLNGVAQPLPSANIRSESDLANEHLVYDGSNSMDSKIYVYISSDNEVIKEALAKYLLNNTHIAVMRVKNQAHIVHAKNIEYLKSAGNNTGLVDLIMDWYSLSLANVIFGWRRDTSMISTFAQVYQVFDSMLQSAQRVSGNSEVSNISAKIGHGIGSKGYQLLYSKSTPAWRPFY